MARIYSLRLLCLFRFGIISMQGIISRVKEEETLVSLASASHMDHMLRYEKRDFGDVFQDHDNVLCSCLRFLGVRMESCELLKCYKLDSYV